MAALALLVLIVVVRYPALKGEAEPAAAFPPAPAASATAATEVQAGFLYGRVTAVDGTTYEGRLRWGGDQEAFWNDSFNGTRDDNPWSAHAPLTRRPGDRGPIEIFGFEVSGGDRPINLERPFMARFGDIARIEAHVADVQITLKSGTTFALDRFAAGDIDDGVRVWDDRRGIVDLDARRIATIEFLPTGRPIAAASRLHGTVRTQQGDFTGFILWNRDDGVGTDELTGRTADGQISLRYDAIRSITRQSRDSALVTLREGGERLLAESRDVGGDSRGTYVDDPRYGWVRIPWNAFDRVDFSPAGSGPAYSDFAPGRRLAGTVTTRDGRRLSGRLVYDFDESETTETLDAALQGINYTIPFGLVAAIVPRGRDGTAPGRATVSLLDGEELQLERTGDLADGTAGMLIFVDGRQQPEYVTWAEVERVDFDRAPAAPASPGERQPQDR